MFDSIGKQQKRNDKTKFLRNMDQPTRSTSFERDPNNTIGTVILHQSTCMVEDLTFCHEDFELKPPNGILPPHTFTWLGFAQYLHVTTGLPHDTLAPRVVLIHRQHVVGTAADLLHIPRNYELRNIVLLDYELDEKSCGIKRAQIQAGLKCPRAYMEISPLEIIPHPEFTRFGVKNSLAIVKLMRPTKSEYVLPICLPTIAERFKRRNHKTVFMIDYVSTVPTDLRGERIGKKSLKLYTHRECRRQHGGMKYGEAGLTQVLCTSGCGIRPGAPIITHTLEGAFELLGIGAGGASCTSKFMRRRLNKDPPVFIDVYPYVSWIINIVTAQLIPKPYPQNFRRVDGGHYGLAVSSGKYLRNKKKDKKGWKGKIYFSGKMCFMNAKKQRRHSVFFYTEKFKVNTIPPARVTVNLNVSAGPETTITCARILLPNQMITPAINGVGTYKIEVVFRTIWFPYHFEFSMGLSGRNSTQEDLVEFSKDIKDGGYWSMLSKT